MTDSDMKKRINEKVENADKKRKNREIQHKNSLREKISFVQTINQITKIEDEVLELAKNEVDLAAPTITAYKTVLDSKWKKINKLLPDLKAIEIEAAVEVSDASTVTDQMLINLLNNDNS